LERNGALLAGAEKWSFQRNLTVLGLSIPKVNDLPCNSDFVSYVKVEGGSLGRMITNSTRNAVWKRKGGAMTHSALSIN
jgi:hypothetical protein